MTRYREAKRHVPRLRKPFAKARAGRLASLAFAASAAFVACTAALAASASHAEAAPRYIDRGLTLPRHDWAFNLGLGLAHVYGPEPLGSRVGAGMNLEMAVGLTENLEIGLRHGIRFGGTARGARADEAGRLFDTETFGTGHNTFSNPELRLRWRFVNGEVGEIGLEGRAYLPFEDGTRVGVMAGLPIALHLGQSVRLDTGVNVPVLFHDPVAALISVPLRVWIQPSEKLFLGPISALRIRFRDTLSFPAPPGTPDATRVDLLLGFGLGVSLARFLDLKFQALFPRITETAGARNFTLGAGVEIRIE